MLRICPDAVQAQVGRLWARHDHCTLSATPLPSPALIFLRLWWPFVGRAACLRQAYWLHPGMLP